MFIKATKFERLIKEAYNNGRLHIGSEDGMFLASGAGWSIAMDEDLMPKEMKAAVIKFVGYMPGDGCYLLALPSGDQTEVPGSYVGKVKTKKLGYAELTRLAYRLGKETYYIGQAVNENRSFMVKGSLIDMIDKTVIEDHDGETDLDGPYIDFPGNQMVVENDRMQMRLFLLSPEAAEAELLDFLEKRDLNSFGEET